MTGWFPYQRSLTENQSALTSSSQLLPHLGPAPTSSNTAPVPAPAPAPFNFVHPPLLHLPRCPLSPNTLLSRTFLLAPLRTITTHRKDGFQELWQEPLVSRASSPSSTPFADRVTCARDLSAQITPFASRTFQFTKEQFGQTDDKVSSTPRALSRCPRNELTTPLCADPAAPRLHRPREEGRCPQAGAPEDACRDVSCAVPRP